LPEQTTEDYDGVAPFPDAGLTADTIGGPLQVAVAGAITGIPIAGLIAAVWLAWGHGVGLRDMLLMTGLYALTGLGVTAGFHRCFTHRSYTAVPVLRVVLAIAGSMSFQGDVISWVAVHRRHHDESGFRRQLGPVEVGDHPVGARGHRVRAAAPRRQLGWAEGTQVRASCPQHLPGCRDRVAIDAHVASRS